MGWVWIAGEPVGPRVRVSVGRVRQATEEGCGMCKTGATSDRGIAGDHGRGRGVHRSGVGEHRNEGRERLPRLGEFLIEGTPLVAWKSVFGLRCSWSTRRHRSRPRPRLRWHGVSHFDATAAQGSLSTTSEGGAHHQEQGARRRRRGHSQDKGAAQGIARQQQPTPKGPSIR